MLILYFAGDLRDTTGTYTTCFYLFGATHLISSGVLFSELLSWCVKKLIFYIIHLYFRPVRHTIKPLNTIDYYFWMCFGLWSTTLEISNLKGSLLQILSYNLRKKTQKGDILLRMWLEGNNVCLFGVFRPTQEFFHPIGDVTITGEGLQSLTYARHLLPLNIEGSLACHTYYPIKMVISEDSWHSHLVPSVC